MSRQNILNYNDNQIILRRGSSPLFARILLLIFTIISFVAPIGATIAALLIGLDFGLGILISYAVFWGFGVYFLRVFLWNSYGKEIISFYNDKIIYNADYKYFKDGRTEVAIDGLQTEIIYEDTMDNHVGRLRIYNKIDTIETVLQSSLTDLEKMKEKIKTRYNTVHIAGRG